jgi:16S rRNA (guanine1207-N2)-methyltransferase
VEHYFSENPKVASRPAVARLSLPDLELELLTDRGVFAYGQVDRGTQLLLRTIPPPPPHGVLLDLGCGYGAVAVTVAKRCPSCRVWAVDVNERAVALCEQNARSAGVDNVHAVVPSRLPPDLRFAALYSNPPIRVGKQSLRDLLSVWISRLEPDGHGYLVVQRALGSDSLAAWLTGLGRSVERMRSRSGYRVLDVHGTAASDHH